MLCVSISNASASQIAAENSYYISYIYKHQRFYQLYKIYLAKEAF